MALCLVTGGAGFIGSHIVIRLIKEGHKVRVIDNLSTGRIENLDEVLSRIDFIEGDIRDEKLLFKVLADVEYVFHQAALPSVPRSFVNPHESLDVNGRGTLVLLLACRDRGVKRVVYASSSSVYGEGIGDMKKEDHPTYPQSPYAISKLLGEQYCVLFSQVYNLSTVSLRYFNIFGPGQNPHSQYAAVIPKFINGFLTKEIIPIYGDGEQSRDFTYVENVVEANLLVCFSDKDISGRIYNVGCGDSHTVNKLVDSLREIIKTEGKVVYENPRPGDIRHSRADISRIKEEIGYTPKKDFYAGIKETVEWYRKNLGES